MAEGPLVHHYVKRLKKVLEGKEARIEFRLHKIKELTPAFQKIRIQKVEAHGKQFQIHLTDQEILLIRSHNEVL